MNKTTYKADYTDGGGTEHDGGTWELVGNTDKTIKLKCLEAGYFTNYEDGQIITIKKDGGRDAFRDWEDGTFTVYFNQNGIPYYFKPVK